MPILVLLLEPLLLLNHQLFHLHLPAKRMYLVTVAAMEQPASIRQLAVQVDILTIGLLAIQQVMAQFQ
jgi:hypothetical protein